MPVPGRQGQAYRVNFRTVRATQRNHLKKQNNKRPINLIILAFKMVKFRHFYFL